jgi:hypothetical protein
LVQITIAPQLLASRWNSAGTCAAPAYTSMAMISIGATGNGSALVASNGK